jgi:hypothetical protein
MAIRIKVNRAEFNQAVSNGEVFGIYLNQIPKLYVYAELGLEREYIPTDREQNTDFKLFTGCYIEFYRTQQDLDSGKAIKAMNETVIIYC